MHLARRWTLFFFIFVHFFLLNLNTVNNTFTGSTDSTASTIGIGFAGHFRRPLPINSFRFRFAMMVMVVMFVLVKVSQHIFTNIDNKQCQTACEDKGTARVVSRFLAVLAA